MMLTFEKERTAEVYFLRTIEMKRFFMSKKHKLETRGNNRYPTGHFSSLQTIENFYTE